MATFQVKRAFFFQPELLSNKTILFISKSPITCYNAVSDMNSYPHFVPWIRKVNMLKSLENKCDCEMTIGFPPITQSYLSHVTLTYPLKIVSISNANAVFDVLESVWEFFPDKKYLQGSEDKIKMEACEAHYSIKFRFASPLYQNLTNMVFNMVFSETAKAFVTRINSLKNVDCVYDKTNSKYIIT